MGRCIRWTCATLILGLTVTTRVWAQAAPEQASPADVAPSGPTADTGAPQRSPDKLPAYVLWGASGASFIVGTILGVSALQAKSQFNAHPSFAGADRADDRAAAADLTLGIGVALAALGTFLFFTHDAEAGSSGTQHAARAAEPTLRLRAAASSHAASVAASLRF